MQQGTVLGAVQHFAVGCMSGQVGRRLTSGLKQDKTGPSDMSPREMYPQASSHAKPLCQDPSLDSLQRVILCCSLALQMLKHAPLHTLRWVTGSQPAQ